MCWGCKEAAMTTGWMQASSRDQSQGVCGGQGVQPDSEAEAQRDQGRAAAHQPGLQPHLLGRCGQQAGPTQCGGH